MYNDTVCLQINGKEPRIHSHLQHLENFLMENDLQKCL